jgi:hypothetical protein
MIFAPYDDMERFDISVNEKKPFAATFGVMDESDPPDVLEPTLASARLWGYLNDHAHDKLLSASAIMAALGWSRIEVLEQMETFLGNGYILCTRQGALREALERCYMRTAEQAAREEVYGPPKPKE